MAEKEVIIPTRETTNSSTVVGDNDTVQSHQTFQKQKAVVRTYNVIWLIVGIIEVLLGFRFLFEITGANPYNSFAQLIYIFSYPFAQPFNSIFGITYVDRSIFDWSLLVAMFVYVLVGYGLIQLLRIIRPVTPQQVNRTMENV